MYRPQVPTATLCSCQHHVWSSQGLGCFTHFTCNNICVPPAGAYSNLVKLQMQQRQVEQETEEVVAEVLEVGHPITRDSLDRTHSR